MIEAADLEALQSADFRQDGIPRAPLGMSRRPPLRFDADVLAPTNASLRLKVELPYSATVACAPPFLARQVMTWVDVRATCNECEVPALIIAISLADQR